MRWHSHTGLTLSEVFQNVICTIGSHVLNTTATHKMCRLISDQPSEKISQGWFVNKKNDEGCIS